MLARVVIAVLFLRSIDVPAVLTPQNGSSTASSNDKGVAWTAEWSMEEVSVNGRRAVRFNEKGSGRTSAFPGEVRWSTASTWSATGTFMPLDTDRTVTASDGSVLLVERKRFDHATGKMTLERQPAGKQSESKSVSIPDDTLAIEGLAGVLRFANIAKSRELEAHIVTNEPDVYSVSFEWRGEETIKTPAGEFECYKVEMVPHLGLLNVVRPFLQKTYFWFTVAAPHNWVRYEGPENGPGSPNVVMELTRQ